MKKLLSIVLAVAMMTTMMFSMMGISASAATEKQSLLPASESDFQTKAMGANGNEEITITKEGDGFKFSSPAGGWPAAWYSSEDQSKWVSANTKDDECYLNWDFSCTAGANVLVFFEGQNPSDSVTEGTGESINYFIDPANGKASTEAVKDLAAGDYKGSIKVSDLGAREDLIQEDGTLRISGIKVFAVGGDVVVRELSVGAKIGDTVTTGANTDSTTAAGTDATTAANSNGATTTAPKTTAANTTSSAKTGDVSNAVLFIVVAAVAAGVVTMSVVASKKSKAR